MATQGENQPPARTAENVGNSFVEQYYQILHHAPEQVYRFYRDTSILCRPDLNGRMRTVTTMNRINDEICNLDYKNYKAEIKSADSQNSCMKGVMVLVTGCLFGKDHMERKFVQTFFLAPQDTGYYVLNDILRYVEEIASYGLSEVATVADDTPSSALTLDPEPAQVIDPPKEEKVTYAVGIKIAEEKENDQVIDERAASQPIRRSERAASHPREIVVAAESLEHSPKRSYASIVTEQTKKGPAKVYVPPTGRVASTKTEKQSVIPVAEPSVSKACATVNAPNIDYAQDEVEGHSIYIRNLPLDVTVAQLEAKFAKFGPIKQNGVHVCRREFEGVCFGFVDFHEFSSMQSAIKASPITIGYNKASVEIRRPTARVGSGRGRISSPRGGFRIENIGGRGNFIGGRGNFIGGRFYVRSDFMWGRGYYSSGRGGEGYHQQGRGGWGSPRP